MDAFSDAGGVFIGSGQSRVDVNSGGYLVTSRSMFHGQDEFGDQVAGMLADDGHAEYPVLARHGEHFDETVCLAYATGLNLESSTLAPYDHPTWVRPLEFGLIMLPLSTDIAWRRRKKAQ